VPGKATAAARPAEAAPAPAPTLLDSFGSQQKPKDGARIVFLPKKS
jgi:hypothetical protein